MFCPNCGKSLPDGSRFCDACGASLKEMAKESLSGAENHVVPETPEEADDFQTEFVRPKKKKKSIKIIGLAFVIVVVIVSIFLVRGLFTSTSGGNNAYVYLSNGKYELINNINKDQTIEIGSSKSDSTLPNLLAFSPDGKYIYYFTKVDTSTYTGSLCRAEYGKLKENSTKNDDYIEIIATNVNLGFTFLEDGTLLYRNGDNTLYYYDGNEPTQIAKSVNYYYTDGSKRVVYQVGDSDEDYTLYGVSLSNINDKIKLASNYSYVVSFFVGATDFDNILYAKKDDDGSNNLYVVGFDKDAEKIGSGWTGSCLYVSDDTIYYSARDGTALNLYDYVTDSYASDDASITEPNLEDFSIPAYSYYTLSSDSDLSDYDVIYTSCTQAASFYTSWYFYRSLQYAAENDYEHGGTYQAFVDKYLSQEDEDGYIVVTDEIQSDLQSLAQTCGQGYEGEWLKLCFYKEQTGTTYDYDAYYAEYEVYNEAESRINTREKLQDKKNDYTLRTIYCYADGNLTTIQENVLSTRYCSGGILFNTSDMIEDTMKLEDVTSITDVMALFALDYEAQNYLLSTSNASISQMSQSAAYTLSEAYNNNGGFDLYVSGSDIYMVSSAELYVAEISGGVLGSFSLLNDDVSVYGVDDTTFYYISGAYDSNDYSYGDLYSCSNGKSAKLAQDVMIGDTINLYNDGSVLAYTGCRMNYGYELTLFESDGTKTIIADDVTQYIRVNKSTLLYISDNDLYLYDGKEKEKTLIRSDVDYLWSQEAMEISQIFWQ